MEIVDELGFDWDEWLDRYVGEGSPGTGSFMGYINYLTHILIGLRSLLG